MQINDLSRITLGYHKLQAQRIEISRRRIRWSIWSFVLGLTLIVGALGLAERGQVQSAPDVAALKH